MTAVFAGARPPGPRVSRFSVAAIVSFAFVLVIVLLIPRGETSRDLGSGAAATAAAAEDIIVWAAPAARSAGWNDDAMPGQVLVRLTVTVENRTEETIPRWVKAWLVQNAGGPDEQMHRGAFADDLSIPYIPAGEMASFEQNFTLGEETDELVLRMELLRSMDDDEPVQVEMPLDLRGH